MGNILVIADDLSGAAEIAGIGWRYHLPTRLLREPVARSFDGLTVIDTDSRLLPSEQAEQRVFSFVEHVRSERFDLVYKKTDSVLRGPVRDEIETLLVAFGRQRAVLVPQNPSRGRTVSEGVYRVDGVPLDQTGFKNDPDHPARSSRVTELLGDGSGAIVIPDASTLDDVRRIAVSVKTTALPAGGADFFQALLEHREPVEPRPFMTRVPGEKRLFVCGSASDQSKQLIARFIRENLPFIPMPDAVFKGSASKPWAMLTAGSMRGSSDVLIAINREIDRSPGAGARLQQALADCVANVLATEKIDTLLLEGGATASAVCHRMDWKTFDLEGELATGAVVMRAQGTDRQRIAIKPGSYPWPDSVWAAD
jgi:uncharacterized protein YgbK (DUF1537 family)